MELGAVGLQLDSVEPDKVYDTIRIPLLVVNVPFLGM